MFCGWRKKLLKCINEVFDGILAGGGGSLAFAAQLSTDARGAIPHDVQQLVVIDYHAMQNSTAAMDLRNRVMPPETEAVRRSAEPLGPERESRRGRACLCALPAVAGQRCAANRGNRRRASSIRRTILANFRKQKVKATMVRTNSIYPMTKYGHGALLRRSLDHDLWRQGRRYQGSGCARRNGCRACSPTTP